MEVSESYTRSNKEIAVSFLERVASGDVRGAFKDYTGNDFCHHNPYFRGEPESLMLAMEDNAVKNPDKRFEVKRAMADEETVAVHSHVRQNPDDPGAVVVHIFRFEHGKIVELWDIGQPIPEDPLNENGVF
ncbi:nuclear transport factor 2 family protein [Rossellomorea vietnamensis]|uniref:Nuclear transport factor 2 family protein n=1 Tax=Rossellomorea vietnamensis TaxID=218284 RepID=A0ACD4C978_9BACI|nr:nuclear transport factor 2 family protein [Rossellomorea vietnamensis]UXH45168.1 nuclear transport factor 2 family protein [Rossellomorea vietnamensis]